MMSIGFLEILENLPFLLYHFFKALLISQIAAVIPGLIGALYAKKKSKNIENGWMLWSLIFRGAVSTIAIHRVLYGYFKEEIFIILVVAFAAGSIPFYFWNKGGERAVRVWVAGTFLSFTLICGGEFSSFYMGEVFYYWLMRAIFLLLCASLVGLIFAAFEHYSTKEKKNPRKWFLDTTVLIWLILLLVDSEGISEFLFDSFAYSFFSALTILFLAGLLGLIPACVARNGKMDFTRWWLYGTVLLWPALVFQLLQRIPSFRLLELPESSATPPPFSEGDGEATNWDEMESPAAEESEVWEEENTSPIPIPAPDEEEMASWEPDSPSFFDLGLALYEKGDLDGAERAFEQACQSKADFARASFNLGITLREKGDLDGAWEAYREVLRVEPGNADAHTNIGVLLQTKGDLEGAINAFRAAVELSSTDPRAHYNLGNALKIQGMLEDALEHFRTCLRLAGKDERLRSRVKKKKSNSKKPFERRNALKSGESLTHFGRSCYKEIESLWNTLVLVSDSGPLLSTAS
jgi:Flp pilus assembly protein TadD